MAFGLQKDSEFTKLFNYHLSLLHESGVVNNHRKQYLDPDPDPIVSNQMEEAFALGYDTLLFPFLTLVFGIGMSLGLLLFEKIKKWQIDILF